MKNFMIVAFLGMFLLSAGCNQPADIDQMLQDTQTRNEIFNHMAADQEMMNEFMQHMGAEHRAMMIKNSDMSGMMSSHPTMMHDMMQGMMKDGQMITHMIQMMYQEDIISEECLQSATQMMQEKGLQSGDHMDNH